MGGKTLHFSLHFSALFYCKIQLLEKKKAFADLGLAERLGDLEKLSKEEGFFNSINQGLNKDSKTYDEVKILMNGYIRI